MSPAGTYFERVEWSERPSINSFEDRTVFQSDGWIEFIREAQGAEPVAAVLISRGELVGQFTGLIIRRLHLKILGSPFPGWTTAYMGFNLLPEFPRQEALTALLKFSRKELRCVHVEFMDRRYHEADARIGRFVVSK